MATPSSQGVTEPAATTLEANLAALARRDPALAERLRLPVRASVAVEGDGRWTLLHHHARLDLSLGPERVSSALEGPGDGGGSGRIVTVLGVGRGELVDALLAREDVARVQAWERDPWILRLELSRADRRAELDSGRLRYALGTDLLRVPLSGETLEHPLLGELYRREIRTARAVGQPRRAVVAGLGLFVEDVCDALDELGLAPWRLDPEGLALEELTLALERLRPELVLAIGYRDGLAEFCHALGIPLVCWEVDPVTTRPRPLVVPDAAQSSFLFTYREDGADELRAAGFRHVRVAPLAANTALRRRLPAEELAGSEPAPVGFVGSSMAENAERCRARFVELLAGRLDPRTDGGAGPGRQDGANGILERVLARQREEQGRFLVPELLEEEVPGARAALLASAAGEDLAILAGEVAASEKRLAWLRPLGRLGLHLWGDAGWRALESAGARYRGPVGQRDELTRVYNAITVHVDVGRLFQSSIVTMRVFDVLACGGFLLTEDTPAVRALFRPGLELDVYRGPEELADKVAHWSERPDEARAIGERGRAAVVAHHRIVARVEEMVALTRG